MRPFFSIIMACCDVEPYIRDAMDSVLKQSFGDWECICGIEDSKDRTEEILREIAAAEPCIRLFHHPRPQLAFHASVSKEPDFDRNLSVCWARRWLQRIIYFWFSPEKIAAISRSTCVETLKSMFENGFGDFDLLAQYVPRSSRTAMGWTRMFVKHSFCRRLAEFLFELCFGFSAMCHTEAKKSEWPTRMVLHGQGAVA